MKPYFENEKTVVYNGDCLEIMKGIDGQSPRPFGRGLSVTTR